MGLAPIEQHSTLADEHVLAILSPASLRHLPVLKLQLPQVFPKVTILAPKDIDDLRRITAQSARRHRVVLAVGGDGTLSQVLRCINLETQVLGTLPTGTGNDFACTIGFPRTLRTRIRHLSTLQPQTTDYLTAGGVPYLNSGGFGIDTETLRVRHQSKGLARRNYIIAFLIVMHRLKPVTAEVEIDGEKLSGKYLWVLAMNTPVIGGGTPITPGAAIDDGRLDVLLVSDMTKLSMLRFMPAAMRGKHLGFPWCTYRQAKSITVRTAMPIDYVALDGEECFWGKPEVTFSCVSNGMQFLR